MKKTVLTILMLALFGSTYAQWSVTSNNVINTNTGYTGISTSLYVSGGTYLQGSLPAGTFVVGQHQLLGLWVPTPAASTYQHYIKIDQPNNQIFISSGNSDLGGGFNRQFNTGETRFFSLPNFNSSANLMTFYMNTTEAARFDASGNFLVGATNANGYKMAVNGSVHCKQINVDLISWSDFVFDKTYRLPSLLELKNYIDQYHHLPDVPTEQEAVKNGVDLGAMNKLLLQKVEELTLYLIEKDAKEKEQEERIDKLEKQVELLIKK